MFCNKKYIVVNVNSGKIVFGSDDMQKATDQALIYRKASGSIHHIFTNSVVVDCEVVPKVSDYVQTKPKKTKRGAA